MAENACPRCGSENLIHPMKSMVGHKTLCGDCYFWFLAGDRAELFPGKAVVTSGIEMVPPPFIGFE